MGAAPQAPQYLRRTVPLCYNASEEFRTMHYTFIPHHLPTARVFHPFPQRRTTMHPIQFGFCVPIFAMPGGRLFRTPNYEQLDTATTMNLARRADALGYDSLWVADHLMLGRDQAILEGWTTLAALAGCTEQARLGMIHQAHFFHHPALAAKMTATLDQISGGRFIYFIDGGNSRHEYLAYGLPWRDDRDERIAHMLDGLAITLALWQSDGPVTMQGDHYHVEGAVCTPQPVQQPHPPVWFGEVHPRTVEACARYAQGWNSVPVSPTEMQRRLDLLRTAFDRAGRSFDELEKSLEIQILIAPTRDDVRQKLAEMLALSPPAEPHAELQAGLQSFIDGTADALPTSLSDTWIVGTPDEITEQLQVYIDLGISHFLLWFMDAPRADGLELFADAVMPQFR